MPLIKGLNEIKPNDLGCLHCGAEETLGLLSLGTGFGFRSYDFLAV